MTCQTHRLRSRSGLECLRILGVHIDDIDIDAAVIQMQDWIKGRCSCNFVAVTGMHGLIEARRDPEFRKVLESAGLIVPDGMPLVWIGRIRGFALKRRVYGPELMLTFLQQTIGKRYKHFFYGGATGVPERLAANVKSQIPGIEIVGTYSPPFRPLTPDEDQQIVSMINDAKPDIVWVGLSTPKQEYWMHDHRYRINVPVMVGVGAAFDFQSGVKRQAPKWMREHGLEWLFRFSQEPRRLWRRYLIYGSQFVFWVVLEQLGLRKFG